MGVITNMRSQMQVVMWTILVLFVTSMAIGGLVGGASITDIFGERQGNEVGSLNGKPIIFEDFNQLVSNEINRADAQSGRPVSDEEREYIRAVVWERLIADLIIQEQIEKNKIVVGADEVLFQMKNNPPPFLQNSEAFQSFGRFDLEKYLEAVLNPGQIDWKPIEDFMQNVYLPNYKLQQYITNAAAITSDDVIEDYKKRFVSHKIEILHITDKAIDKDFNALFSALSKENEKEAIAIIGKIRASLYDVDSCLDDCNNILVGYAQELFNVDNPEMPQELEEATNESR